MEEQVYSIDYILENEIDKKAYGFVYITTNLINEKKYIGKRKFSKYNGGWENYLGSGKIIKQSIKRDGKENFNRKIISIAYSENELNQLEIEIINKYNATKDQNYYNIALGGEGGNTYKGKTKEEIKNIKNKLSLSRKGENHHFYGKHLSDEHKRKIYESKKGKYLKENNPFYGIKHSKEAREKISKARKGQYYGENHPFYGKHHSEETKRKISLIRKDKYCGANNPRAKRIICITTEEIFPFIIEATKKYNANRVGISRCCKKKQNYCGIHPITGESLEWMYYEDYLKQQNTIVQ